MIAGFMDMPRAGVENRQEEHMIRPRETEYQVDFSITGTDGTQQMFKIYQDLVLVEEEETERARGLEEKNRAVMEERIAEWDILIQKQRVMKAEAWAVTESSGLLTKIEKLQERVRVLEEERDSSRLKAKEAEKEKEIA